MTDRLACVALLGLATCPHRELVSPLDAAAKAQPRRDHTPREAATSSQRGERTTTAYAVWFHSTSNVFSAWSACPAPGFT